MMLAPTDFLIIAESYASQMIDGRMTIDFNQPINLKGNYEVCVSDVIFNKSFNNVLKAKLSLLFAYPYKPEAGKEDEFEEEILKEVLTFASNNSKTKTEKHLTTNNPFIYYEVLPLDQFGSELEIEMGHYSNEELIEKINNLISTISNQAMTKFPKLEYETHNSLVSLIPGWTKTAYIYLKFDTRMNETLGFGVDSYKNLVGRKIVGINPLDLAKDIRYILLSSSLVKNSFVNRQWLPLLRLIEVPLNAKFGESCSINFSNNIYLKCSINEFNKIDLHFTYNNGKPVIFETGNIAVTLHIKKIK